MQTELFYRKFLISQNTTTVSLIFLLASIQLYLFAWENMVDLMYTEWYFSWKFTE